jgi:hypothetical protein
MEAAFLGHPGARRHTLLWATLWGIFPIAVLHLINWQRGEEQWLRVFLPASCRMRPLLWVGRGKQTNHGQWNGQSEP